MNNVASSQHTSPAVMLDLLRAERSAGVPLLHCMLLTVFVQLRQWPIVGTSRAAYP